MSSEPIPKKSLGQHWLDDPYILDDICSSAEINSDDVVLEIGPGPGSLTKLLSKKAKRVIAVEFDKYWANELKNKLKLANVEVRQSDILSFDLSTLPAEYKVVANIPYYLTSNLIRVLSESSNPPSSAVLLIQKEVARRVVAEPGDMSLLSVTAQYYWQVELGIEVPAELFTPPPKVDSQVLIMRRHPEPLYKNLDAKDFFRTVKAGFSQRRKTLLNSLSAGLHLDKKLVESICKSVEIDPKRRAQTLSIDEWHKLHCKINT